MRRRFGRNLPRFSDKSLWRISPCSSSSMPASSRRPNNSADTMSGRPKRCGPSGSRAAGWCWPPIPSFPPCPEDDLTGYFKRFSELTTVKDYRKKRVYVLTNYNSSHEQDLYRVYTLRDMGFDPYVMVYEKPTAPPITRKLQRWVNNKWFFRAVPDFNDFDPSGWKSGINSRK